MNSFTVPLSPRRAHAFLARVWSQDPDASVADLDQMTERELSALLVSFSVLGELCHDTHDLLVALACRQGFLPVAREIRACRPGEQADTDLLDRLLRDLSGEGHNTLETEGWDNG